MAKDCYWTNFSLKSFLKVYKICKDGQNIDLSQKVSKTTNYLSFKTDIRLVTQTVWKWEQMKESVS